MSRARQFRELLQRDGLTIAPGAYDCITARTIAQAGFGAVYMTGAGTAATLGYPDYGLVTMSEMADNAGRIAAAVDVPVIADADTGYGNELNATRTVREYERRGVAGLHIEDQGFPEEVRPPRQQGDRPARRISAPRSAPRSRRGTIPTSSSSRAPTRAPCSASRRRSRRANAALEAGADMAFVEAPQTLEEVAAVPRLVKGPCLLNVVWRGKTPEVAFDDAQRMGYKLAIVPGMLFKAVIGVCDATLKELRRTGRHPVPADSMTVRDAFRRVGADEWDAVSENHPTVPHRPRNKSWSIGCRRPCSTGHGRPMFPGSDAEEAP